MQKDIMVPAEDVVDGQLEHRLAPLVAGQELASTLIQDTAKYLGIQPTGISQLNGPYLQVRPAGSNASDILLVGSWRTHFGPGGDRSGPVLDTLERALPKPTPAAQLMATSAASAPDKMQIEHASPYAPARMILTQTGSLTSPVTAAAAAAGHAPYGQPTNGTVSAAAPYNDPHYQNRSHQHAVLNGACSVLQPHAGSTSPSSNGPIVECPSDTEPSPSQQLHHRHRRRRNDSEHRYQYQALDDEPTVLQGRVSAAEQRGGSPGVAPVALLTAPAAASGPDRAVEDVSTIPGQPLNGQEPGAFNGSATVAQGRTPRAEPAAKGHLVRLQGSGIPAAAAFATAAAVQAAGMGADPSTAVVPAAGTGVGALTVVPRPRSEWELDPAKIIIGRRLAVGGFGEVFLARYEGTLVAVKRLLATDSDTTQRFLDEVHMLARLRHPNLLLFMGYTLTPEPSIVTEFMARGSLFHILRQSGNRPPEPRMQRAVAVAVARGMAYLHSRNPPIMHLDLKSPNVLVDDRWRVKIADFGLSRVRQRTYVSSGAAAGSPEWMAPEVLRCDHYAEAADVYSFGVVLWELLTGKAPWADLNAMQVVGAVGFARRSLPDPTEGDQLLVQLCKACRAYDPSQRPSFAQIVEAMERHFNSGGGTGAQPPVGAPMVMVAPGPTGSLAAGPAGEGPAAAMGAFGRGGAGSWKQQQQRFPALPAPEIAASSPAEPLTLAAGVGGGGGGGGAGAGGDDSGASTAAAAAVRITRGHSLASSSDNDGIPGATVSPGDGSVSSGGGGVPPRLDSRFMSVHESLRSRRRYRSPRGEDMLGPPAITARLQDGRKTPSPRTSGGVPWRGEGTESQPRLAQPQPPSQAQPQPEQAAGAPGGVRLMARSASPFAAAAAAEFGPGSVDDLRSVRACSGASVVPTAGGHDVGSAAQAAADSWLAGPQPMDCANPEQGALSSREEQPEGQEQQQRQPSAAALDVSLPLPPVPPFHGAPSVGGNTGGVCASDAGPSQPTGTAVVGLGGPYPSPSTHTPEGRPQGQLQQCAMHQDQKQQESSQLSHTGQSQYEQELQYGHPGAHQALPPLLRQTEQQQAWAQVQPAQQHCPDTQTAHMDVQRPRLELEQQEQHQQKHQVQEQEQEQQEQQQEQQQQQQTEISPVATDQPTTDRPNGARPGHRRVSSDEAGRLVRVSGALGLAASVTPAGADAASGQAGAAAVQGPQPPPPPSLTQMLPPQLQQRILAAIVGGAATGGGGGGLPPRRSRGLARNSAPMRYTYGGTSSGAGSQPHHQLQSPPRPRGPHSLGHISYTMHQQVLTANAEAAAAAAALSMQPHPSQSLAASPLQGQRPGSSAPGTPTTAFTIAPGGAEPGAAALGAPVSLSPVAAADLTGSGAATDASGRLALADYHDPAFVALGGVMGAAGAAAVTDPWPDTHSELSFAFILRDNVSVCSDDYMQSASLDRLPLLEEDDMADPAEAEPSDDMIAAAAAARAPTSAAETHTPLHDTGAPPASRAGTGNAVAGKPADPDHEFELPKPFLQPQPELSPKGVAAAAPPGAVSPLAADPAPLWGSGPYAKAEGGSAAEVQVEARPEADLWAALQQHGQPALQRRGSGGLVDVPAVMQPATGGCGAVSVTGVDGRTYQGRASQGGDPHSLEAPQGAQQPQPQQGDLDPPSRTMSRVPSGGSAGATTYRTGRFKVTIEPASQDTQPQAAPRQTAAAPLPQVPAPQEPQLVGHAAGSPQAAIEASAAAKPSEAVYPTGPVPFAPFAGHDDALPQTAPATQSCPDCNPAVSSGQAPATAAPANGPPSPSAVIAALGAGQAAGDAARTPGHARSSQLGHAYVHGHTLALGQIGQHGLQPHGHGHGHHGHSELSGGPPVALNSVTMYRKGRFFVSSHAAAGTHSLSVTNPLAAAAVTSSHTGTAGAGSVDESDEHDGASGPTSPFVAPVSLPPCARAASQSFAADGAPPPVGLSAKMSWAAVAALPPSHAVRQEALGRQYSCGRFTVAESIVAAPCPEPRRAASGGSAPGEPGSAAATAVVATPVGRDATAADGSAQAPPARALGAFPNVASALTLTSEDPAPGVRRTGSCLRHQEPQLLQALLQQSLPPPSQRGPTASRFAAPPPLRVSATGMDTSAPASGHAPGAEGEAGSGGGATPGTAPTSPRPEQVVVRKVGRFTVREVEGGSNASSRAPSNSGTPTPDGQPTAGPAVIATEPGAHPGGNGNGKGGGSSGGGAMLQGSPPDEAMILSSHHSSCSFTSASGFSRASSASHGLDLDVSHPPHAAHHQELLQPSQQESNQAQAHAAVLLQGLVPSQEHSRAQALLHGFQPSQHSSHVPLPPPPQLQLQQGGLPASQQDSSNQWLIQQGVLQASQQESQPLPQGLLPQPQEDPQQQQQLLLRVAPSAAVGDEAAAAASGPAAVAAAQPLGDPEARAMKVLRVKSKGRFTVIEHETVPLAQQQQPLVSTNAGAASRSITPQPAQLPPGQAPLATHPAALGAESGAPKGQGHQQGPADDVTGSEPSQQAADGSAAAGPSFPLPARATGSTDNKRLSPPWYGGVLHPPPRPPRQGPQSQQRDPLTRQDMSGPSRSGFGVESVAERQEQQQHQQQAGVPWGLSGPQDADLRAQFHADSARLVRERMERNALERQLLQQQQQLGGASPREARGRDRAGDGGAAEEDRDGGGGSFDERCTYEVSFGDGLTIQISHGVHPGEGAMVEGESDGEQEDDPGGDALMVDVGIVHGDGEAEVDEGDDESGGGSDSEADGNAEAADGHHQQGVAGEVEEDWEVQPLRPPETPTHEPAMERERTWLLGSDSLGAGRRQWRRRRRGGYDDVGSDDENSMEL